MIECHYCYSEILDDDEREDGAHNICVTERNRRGTEGRCIKCGVNGTTVNNLECWKCDEHTLFKNYPGGST